MAKKTSREKLNKLIKKRKRLKERKEEGKVTLFGNRRRRKIQERINKNKSAQEDLAESKRKKKEGTDPTPPSRPHANPKEVPLPRHNTETKMRVKKNDKKKRWF
tara:strand:+ start:3815 stop:4126 length:312 start_codon:yes stop_codon:yes gene_type:complete